jgi:hypothetical protein
VVGRYNLNQYDIAKKIEKQSIEAPELRDSKLGFSSKTARFPEKIVEVEEPEDHLPNEVNKIFEQLPTYKAQKSIEQPRYKANRQGHNRKTGTQATVNVI